jgi:hypothetical protein
LGYASSVGLPGDRRPVGDKNKLRSRGIPKNYGCRKATSQDVCRYFRGWLDSDEIDKHHFDVDRPYVPRMRIG